MKCFTTFLISLFLVFSGNLVSQEVIHLWDGFDTNGGGQVTLTPYLAEKNETGISVIVCPGGSYYWLDKVTEGEKVARWLQSNGISAFVLRYRTAGFWAFLLHYRYLFSGQSHPDMISDAQCALQWVRTHADNYHIDPKKVGMLGFSAGGHLVMSTVCFHNHNFVKDAGGVDETNLCPAFVGAIYPVVTMKEPYVHKRSRRALLTEKHQNDQTMIDSLSLELHIPKDCPPVFLVNCVDDLVVDYHNAMLLDSALTANKIDHRYIQYKTGGHGFGANERRGSEECRQWKDLFLKWMKEKL